MPVINLKVGSQLVPSPLTLLKWNYSLNLLQQTRPLVML